MITQYNDQCTSFDRHTILINIYDSINYLKVKFVCCFLKINKEYIKEVGIYFESNNQNFALTLPVEKESHRIVIFIIETHKKNGSCLRSSHINIDFSFVLYLE